MSELTEAMAAVADAAAEYGAKLDALEKRADDYQKNAWSVAVNDKITAAGKTGFVVEIKHSFPKGTDGPRMIAFRLRNVGWTKPIPEAEDVTTHTS